MKKTTIFLLLMSVGFSFMGCNNNEIEIQVLSFNDYHGAVQLNESQAGLELFASTIKEKTSKYKDRTIILSAGDMCQGSAESNLGHGKIIIDTMNEIGLDAMTIGNHEFDWGIEEIKNHHDGKKDNNEANYAYLGCNIYEKDSNTRVDWADDYKIVTRKDINIGIIGWIGSDCVDSIATSIIEPYSFTNPNERIVELAKHLRENENCDIIIAMGHEQNDLLNQSLGLNDVAQIDLIINGHTHQSYVEEYDSYNVIQSGTVGEYLGVTKIKVDKSTKSVKSIKTENENINRDLKVYEEIANIVNENLEEISPIINRVIGKSGENIDRSKASKWAAKVVESATGADLGIINWGGIRANAFPIRRNDDIKVSKIWEIMPFDNVIKTVKLTGKQIKNLEFNNDSFVFSKDDYKEIFNDDEYYKVAACDYIFDKPQYEFLKGKEITITPLLVRDALIADIEEWTRLEEVFIPSNGTKIGNLL